MVQYSDYMTILKPLNFIGGAGKLALSNVGNNDRALITQDGNGIYQFNYFIADSFSDLTSLGYYDTPSDDYDNDLIYDPEYQFFSETNVNTFTQHNIQSAIISSVLNSSVYGVSFSDVANTNFSVNANATVAAAEANIVIGTMTPDGTRMVSGAFANTIDLDAQISSGTTDFNILRQEQLYGDVWLNDAQTAAWDSSDIGSAGYWLIMHEIGHSLGLDHTNPTVDLDPNDPNYVQVYSSIDNQKFSIMSYNGLPGMDDLNVADDEVTPFGLQLLDIAAIQEIYGHNYTTRDMDTTYSKMTAFASTRINEAFIYTIWDGNGNDTIDGSGYADGSGNAVRAYIDLRQGSFSSIGLNALGQDAVDNVAIAYHTIIENATGGDGNDILIGNAWNNILIGGAGNDIIYGDGLTYYDHEEGYGANDGNHEIESGVAAALDGSGADTLYGGAGDDLFIAGAGNDVIFGDADIDTIEYNTSQNVIALYSDENTYLSQINRWYITHENNTQSYTHRIEGIENIDAGVYQTGNVANLSNAYEDYNDLYGATYGYSGITVNDHSVADKILNGHITSSKVNVDYGVNVNLADFTDIIGTSYDDSFYLNGVAYKSIDAGAGNDLINFSTNTLGGGLAEGVDINFVTGAYGLVGQASSGTLSGFELAIGSINDDIFTLDNNSPNVNAGGGDDIVYISSSGAFDPAP